MKKNGDIIFIMCGVALGYAAGRIYMKYNNNFPRSVSASDRKHINMLKEFYFEDYGLAVKKYLKYIGMGLSSQDALDTVMTIMPVDLLMIGEIND